MDIFSNNVKAFAVEWNVMDSLTLSISTRELEMEEVRIFWDFSIILYLVFFSIQFSSSSMAFLHFSSLFTSCNILSM